MKGKSGEEVWKPIPGHEQRYHASSLGRIRGPRTILKPLNHPRGYPCVNLYVGNQPGRSVRFVQDFIHRFVAEAFLGPCPEGKQINHRNLDKSDNRAANLEYVTAKENQQHARRNKPNWAPFGPKHYAAKLSAAAVRYIRTHGDSSPTLAARFGVNQSTISRVRSRDRRARG